MKKNQKDFGKFSKMKKTSMKILLGGVERTQGTTRDTSGSSHGWDVSTGETDKCWEYEDGTILC